MDIGKNSSFASVSSVESFFRSWLFPSRTAALAALPVSVEPFPAAFGNLPLASKENEQTTLTALAVFLALMPLVFDCF